MFQKIWVLLSWRQYCLALHLAKALVSQKARHNVRSIQNSGNEKGNPYSVTVCDWYGVLQFKFRRWKDSKSGLQCVGKLEITFFRQTDFFRDFDEVIALLEAASIMAVDDFRVYGTRYTKNSIASQLPRPQVYPLRGYTLDGFRRYVDAIRKLQPEIDAIQAAYEALIARAKEVVPKDNGLLTAGAIIMGLSEGYGEPEMRPLKGAQIREIDVDLGDL